MSFQSTHCFLLAGLFFLAAWLLRTSLGRDALKVSRPRRHDMLPMTPVLAMLLWRALPFFLVESLATWKTTLPSWQGLLVDHLSMILCGVITAVVILLYARRHFVRGLKGLGLRRRGFLLDIRASGATLLAVWPLVLAMLLGVTWLGQRQGNDDYQIQEHQALEQLTQHTSEPALLVAIVVMAVGVAPFVEELLFRGLLQTVMRSYVNWPWLCIVVTSVFFAMVHGEMTHWPSLFVLSVAMGYSYEVSGSLWRPIIVHALFNGLTIAAQLSR